MNRLQSQVQSHLSAVRQNSEKLLTKGLSKSIRQSPQPTPNPSSKISPQTTDESFIRETQVTQNHLGRNPGSKSKPRVDSSVNFINRNKSSQYQRAKLPAGSPLSLDFAHRLFTPEHYEERYEYPLVIWLHSQDSSEYELDGIMPHLSIRNYVAIAPRAIQTSKLSHRKFCWSQSVSGTAMAEELVMQSIAHAINDLSIRPNRVFLAGYGTGGTLAQSIGLRNSSSIAGVVSINGAFPQRCRELLPWRDSRNLPVLFMHGGDSTLCDTEQTCHALQSAHRASLSYQFAQFPCGDELNTAMTLMANQFMMEIVSR